MLFPPLGITVAEVGMIVGAVGGPTALVGAYINLRKAGPEERSLALGVGEKGVKVLDGVVDTLTVQWEREVKARERCEERLTRLYDDLRQKDEDLKDKDHRIRQEQASYRFMVEQRDEQIRELIERLAGTDG